MNERSIQQRHKKREQVALGQPLLLVAATVRQLSRGRSDRSSNVVSTAAGVSKGYNACMSSAATSTTNSNWSNSNPTVEEITTANEEAFLSNQGTRMIPCLARRMSEDHNATTAYFKISFDAQHASVLTCSHWGCRQAGIKFLYCSHCGIPVAKKTFWRRHNHNGESSQMKAEDQVMLPPPMPRLPSVIVNTHSKRPNNLESSSNKRARMTKEMSDSDETSSLAVLARSSISSFTNESRAQSLERQKQSLDEEYRNRPLRISSQELEWIHLLRARPESNDLPEFRSWIDQVVKATDKIGGEASASTELSTSESPSNTGNSSSEDGSSDGKEGTSESSAEESAIDKHKRTHENDGFSGSASSSYGASTSNTSSLSSEEGSASSDDPTSSSSVLEVNRITDDSADSGKQ